MNQKACCHCRYWDPEQHPAKGFGECRKRCPLPDGANGCKFPATPQEFYCWEYERCRDTWRTMQGEAGDGSEPF
jgi:hypothetical protein